MEKAKSPGPVYMLPPTVGYNKHDVSRYRNPQYSMSPNVRLPSLKNLGPGPQYQVSGINEHGKFSYPAYTIKSRPKPLTQFVTPGPGAHSPEKVPRMKEIRPPAYSMRTRDKLSVKGLKPGSTYTLPFTPSKRASETYNSGEADDITIYGKYTEGVISGRKSEVAASTRKVAVNDKHWRR